MADNELIIRINGSAKNFLEELDKIQKKTEDLQKVLDKTAKASAIAFAGFAGSIALTTKEFANYETALVGVGKTTNITGKSLENFGKEFQKLSTEIPVSTNELLGIAQAAGQLGVTGEKNLLKFTQTVAKLGVATDLSGEQAATTLTRILTVTGEGVEAIDTFGSVIVALGNNFAATESEIARVTTEVARSTAVFGTSSAQAAALATALKSVGVQAELGGSATGRAFRAIDAAVREGGKSLDDLAKLTGKTGTEIQKIFREDSVQAFQLFIEGLGRIQRSGGDTTAELEKFGLKGEEILKVLPVLAQRSELVAQALEVANKETRNATALNDEAEKAYATLNSEKEKLVNTATNLASRIGEQLAPAIKNIIIDTTNFLKRVQTLDAGIIESIASFLKWGAIISGIVAGVTAAGLAIVKISGIIAALSAAFLPATIAASGFWVALTGPIGLAVAGLAAVGAGVAFVVSKLNSAEKPETLIEINKELDKLQQKRDELQKGNIRTGVVDTNAIKEIDDQVKKLEELRQAKIRASEDFGTGSLLVRPEADQGVNLGAEAFGLDKPIQAPLLPEQDTSGELSKKVEKDLNEVNNIVDAKTQERIDRLKAANANLLEIQKARAEQETEEEKKVAQRKVEIEQEKAQASQITNQEERAAALENLNLKYAEEIAEIERFEAGKEERQRARLERQALLDQEFKNLSKEQQALFDEEDLTRLQEKILTEDEIKQRQKEQEIEQRLRDRELLIAEEQQFGKTFAAIKAFFRQEEIQGVRNASQQLVQLTNSRNETLKGIGKAAAATNAAIATSEGAIKAYSSLAGIPIVGPGLGVAAAAALVAYGVEQQSRILAANTGGLVPSSLGRAGVDSVPAMLTPGEVVTPTQNYDELINSVAAQRGFVNPEEAGSATGGNQTITIVLEPKDDFINFIEQKMIETRIQNTNVG